MNRLTIMGSKATVAFPRQTMDKNIRLLAMMQQIPPVLRMWQMEKATLAFARQTMDKKMSRRLSMLLLAAAVSTKSIRAVQMPSIILLTRMNK